MGRLIVAGTLLLRYGDVLVVGLPSILRELDSLLSQSLYLHDESSRGRPSNLSTVIGSDTYSANS